MDYGAFASGGINLGNLNLEFVAARGGWKAQSPAALTAIALEPALGIDDVVHALDERAITHSAPMPTPGWTNVGLGGFPDGLMVFFCDYHFPDAKDHGARQAALDAARGGALGLRRAHELVLSAIDVDEVTERWNRLLSPLAAGNDRRWSMPSGVSLCVQPGDVDQIRDLAIEVADPDAAAQRWAELGGPDRVEGLALSFVTT